MNQYSTIFQPAEFGTLKLQNRVVMAPMTRRFAGDDGVPTQAIADYYGRRAAGEVGLIISEGVAVDSEHAYDTITVPRIETEAQQVGWRLVVDAVHAAGGTFAPQLWHTGNMAYWPIGPSEADMPLRKDGTPRPRVKAMDDTDFAQVREAFVNSATAAKAIGCDAIELHGAHGYLLDSFLSPSSNQRTDEYGGSAENRRRFPLEVTRAVRTAIGPDFPIIYRFSQWKIGDDTELKFKQPDDLEAWVTALRDAGVDILHVSTQRAVEPAFAAHGERTLAGWTRHLSGLPTIAVGGVSTTLAFDEAYGGRPDVAADPAPAIELVERGEVDLLAIGRALIPNPEWVKIVRDGDWRTLVPFDKAQLERLE